MPFSTDTEIQGDAKVWDRAELSAEAARLVPRAVAVLEALLAGGKAPRNAQSQLAAAKLVLQLAVDGAPEAPPKRVQMPVSPDELAAAREKLRAYLREERRSGVR